MKKRKLHRITEPMYQKLSHAVANRLADMGVSCKINKHAQDALEEAYIELSKTYGDTNY